MLCIVLVHCLNFQDANLDIPPHNYTKDYTPVADCEQRFHSKIVSCELGLLEQALIVDVGCFAFFSAQCRDYSLVILGAGLHHRP